MSRVEFLEALRAELKMNQPQFANALDCSQSWMSRLLANKGALSERQIGRIYVLSVELGDDARKRFSEFLRQAGAVSNG